MSRKNRLCSDEAFLLEVLNEAEVVYVGFAGGEFPYVLPFNFVYFDGAVWLHTGHEGTKFDRLAADPRVGFSLTSAVSIDQAKKTTYYKSVCGTGTIAVVDDADLKRAALAALARRYKAACSLPVPEEALQRTGVLRITVSSLSGKRHLPPAAHS